MATQGVRTPAGGKQEQAQDPPKDGKKAEGETKKKKTTKKTRPKKIAFPIETGDLLLETLEMADHERKTIFGRVLEFIRNMFRPPAPPGDRLLSG